MLYKTIAHHLAAHDLNMEKEGWKRMIIEKPFGYDLETARALNIGTFVEIQRGTNLSN